MKLTQQPCLNGTVQVTRRVFVDLWAHETLLQKRRVVIEVPSDCTNEELKRIGGNALDDWANAEQVDSQYETEEPDEFQVLESITVESGVPDHLDSDLVFERDENHGLVLSGREGEE